MFVFNTLHQRRGEGRVTGKSFDPGKRKCRLSPIVGLRFGMDEHAKQVGNFLAEASFERSLNVVHARERQVVQHGAVQ